MIEDNTALERPTDKPWIGLDGSSSFGWFLLRQVFGGVADLYEDNLFLSNLLAALPHKT